jgi:two-component system, response regulator PdtaR
MGYATTKRPVVFVVEDDFLIRMHAAEMIEEPALMSWRHRTPMKAVAILEARLDIAVVFTDIQMPGSMTD